MKPKVLIFASGGKKSDSGGSGFETMVQNTRLNPPILNAEIVGVISNHEFGGVWTKAKRLEIPFRHFKGPYDAECYQKIISEFDPDFIMLSGWLKPFYGFEPANTINIHPGPLPLTAGKYGHHVHETVLDAYKKGKITQSAVIMHFVTEEYDRGPIFFSWPVYIDPSDTPETLGKRVNEVERVLQSRYLNMVIHGEIWLGTCGWEKKTLKVCYIT